MPNQLLGIAQKCQMVNVFLYVHWVIITFCASFFRWSLEQKEQKSETSTIILMKCFAQEYEIQSELILFWLWK